jgi:hypothetical protein
MKLFSYKKLPLRLVDVGVILVTLSFVCFGLARPTNKAVAGPEVTCSRIGKTHVLYIKNDQFAKSQYVVPICDTIMLVNLDTQPYLLAFGTHEKHIEYPGFPSAIISQNESLSFAAVQDGHYHLHDHLRDQAVTDVVITPATD